VNLCFKNPIKSNIKYDKNLIWNIIAESKIRNRFARTKQKFPGYRGDPQLFDGFLVIFIFSRKLHRIVQGGNSVKIMENNVLNIFTIKDFRGAKLAFITRKLHDKLNATFCDKSINV